MQTIKQWKHCWYLDFFIIWFIDSESFLFSYLLYLTLVYKIVKNNSTKKYQQNRIKYNRNQNYNKPTDTT